MKPKLWNGPSAVGESAARGNEISGAEYQTRSGPGFVARKKGQFSEVFVDKPVPPNPRITNPGFCSLGQIGTEVVICHSVSAKKDFIVGIENSSVAVVSDADHAIHVRRNALGCKGEMYPLLTYHRLEWVGGFHLANEYSTTALSKSGRKVQVDLDDYPDVIPLETGYPTGSVPKKNPPVTGMSIEFAHLTPPTVVSKHRTYKGMDSHGVTSNATYSIYPTFRIVLKGADFSDETFLKPTYAEHNCYSGPSHLIGPHRLFCSIAPLTRREPLMTWDVPGIPGSNHTMVNPLPDGVPDIYFAYSDDYGQHWESYANSGITSDLPLAFSTDIPEEEWLGEAGRWTWEYIAQKRINVTRGHFVANQSVAVIDPVTSIMVVPFCKSKGINAYGCDMSLGLSDGDYVGQPPRDSDGRSRGRNSYGADYGYQEFRLYRITGDYVNESMQWVTGLGIEQIGVLDKSEVNPFNYFCEMSSADSAPKGVIVFQFKSLRRKNPATFNAYNPDGGADIPHKLAISSDHGATWTYRTLPWLPWDTGQIHWLDEKTMLCVARVGGVYVLMGSIDFGESWESLSTIHDGAGVKHIGMRTPTTIASLIENNPETYIVDGSRNELMAFPRVWHLRNPDGSPASASPGVPWLTDKYIKYKEPE